MLRARHYQKPTDPIRALADASRRPVARDIRAALGDLRRSVNSERVSRLASYGLWWNIKHEVDWPHWREIMRKPFGRLIKVHDVAAEIGLRQINGKFGQRGIPVRFKKGAIGDPSLGGNAPKGETFLKDAGDLFNYDRLNRETVASLRQYQDALIADLERQARDSIDSAVQLSIRDGLVVDEVADYVRQVIGLTNTQAVAIENYRLGLQGMDSSVLNRALMSAEAQAVFADAKESGKPLSAAIIDGLVQDYTERYLDYRATTISQTETIRAANLGLHDVYRQAVQRGAIPAEAITRNWQIALDERVCPHCRSIPENDPNGVGIDESFNSDDGPVDDPPQHPGCRCSVVYVTNLDLV